MAYYTLHKFHWKPKDILNLSREEKAFVLAAIEVRIEAEKAEEKKINAKKPRARRK